MDPQWHTWSTFNVAMSGMLTVMVFIGNFSVLFIGCCKQSIRNSPFHLALLSHSLACLLLSIFVYPVMTRMVARGLIQSDIDRHLCFYSRVGLMWWVGVSLLSNAVVAVNRAMSCFPHLKLSSILRGRRVTVGCLMVVWITAMLLYLVPAVMYRNAWEAYFACLPIMEHLAGLIYPVEDLDVVSHHVRNAYGGLVLFAVIVSLFSYAVIIWYLFKGSKKESARRRREKLHALCIMAIVFSALFICWAPMMWGLLWTPELLRKSIEVSLLPLIEAVLTPILYVISMPVFRPQCFAKGVIHVAPASFPANRANVVKTTK